MQLQRLNRPAVFRHQSLVGLQDQVPFQLAACICIATRGRDAENLRRLGLDFQMHVQRQCRRIERRAQIGRRRGQTQMNAWRSASSSPHRSIQHAHHRIHRGLQHLRGTMPAHSICARCSGRMAAVSSAVSNVPR